MMLWIWVRFFGRLEAARMHAWGLQALGGCRQAGGPPLPGQRSRGTRAHCSRLIVGSRPRMPHSLVLAYSAPPLYGTLLGGALSSLPCTCRLRPAPAAAGRAAPRRTRAARAQQAGWLGMPVGPGVRS